MPRFNQRDSSTLEFPIVGGWRHDFLFNSLSRNRKVKPLTSVVLVDMFVEQYLSVSLKFFSEITNVCSIVNVFDLFDPLKSQLQQLEMTYILGGVSDRLCVHLAKCLLQELVLYYQSNSLERSFPEVPIALGQPYKDAINPSPQGQY